MKNSHVAVLLLLSLALVLGCAEKTQETGPKLVHERPLGTGGKIRTYEALDGTTFQQIWYRKDNIEYEGYLDPGLQPALDWMRGSADFDAKFLCWWDHGHAIRGFGNKNVIIFNPSKSILSTVASYAAGQQWDEKTLGTLSSDADIKKVAEALMTANPSATKGIMTSYGAKYLLVSSKDATLASSIAKAAGVYETLYDETGAAKPDLEKTVLFMAGKGETLKGFSREFYDGKVAVYKTQ